MLKTYFTKGEKSMNISKMTRKNYIKTRTNLEQDLPYRRKDALFFADLQTNKSYASIEYIYSHIEHKRDVFK